MRRSLVVSAILLSALQQIQPPTFRSGTNLVQIDAIVDDRDGEPVTDLTVDDFELQDDGKPMAIRSLRLLGQSSELRGPFAPIRNVDDELREASRDEVQVFAILLDDYHVVRQREQKVIPPLRSFIEHLPATDLVGVYGLFDSIRDPHLNRDREAALKAIAAFYGRRGDYTPKFPVEEEHLRQMRDIESIRLAITRGALEALAVHLGGLKEGRKTLLFVTEGFPMDTGDMRDISMAANRLNVAIYPVDPLGMPVGVTRGNAGALGMTGGKDVLKQFALDTGGVAIVGTNDFDRGLAHVARDSSAYYLLAYESPHPDDGKFHNVSVKVKRPRVTVRARSGYLAFKQAETTASAPAAPVSADVKSALARLAESLRPDAAEPAEPRRLHMPDPGEAGAAKETAGFLAAPVLAVAQGRLAGPAVSRREFPRVGTLVARAVTRGKPDVTSRLLAQDGRPLTDLPVVADSDTCEVRLALPTLGQGDYVLELTGSLDGRTIRQYVAFRVRR